MSKYRDLEGVISGEYNWSVEMGNYLDVLPRLPDNSIDLVIADPNYGETRFGWDVQTTDWLKPIDRVLKPSGSLWCFGSMRARLRHLPGFSGWKLAQDVVWEKHNGSGFQADRFRRVHEHIVQLYRGKWRDVYRSPVYTLDAIARSVNRNQSTPHMSPIENSHYETTADGPRLMRSVFHVRSCHRRGIHPTQKPVDVITPLIQYSCPSNGIVLDHVLGSGSTAIAALKCGCRCIGIEQENKYALSAYHRISKAHQES
jgi:site-specific DNA-methyltransferase (adenine-specific)